MTSRGIGKKQEHQRSLIASQSHEPGKDLGELGSDSGGNRKDGPCHGRRAGSRDGNFQINDGWVALTDPGPHQLDVFMRSPAGVVSRLNDSSYDSFIDKLGENGEVMLVSDSQRYFSKGAGLVPISAYFGRSYRVAGTWYLAFEHTLLSVKTD